MKRLLLIHGPNLNRLGERSPEHYGRLTLGELEAKCRSKAEALGYEMLSFQSNHEGELIDFIQAHPADAILINPGALSHSSYALHDALLDTQAPCIEVHLSKIHERETWRRRSLVAPACLTQISGSGPAGYEAAMELFTRPIHAVMGTQLQRSWSPALHQAAYQKLGLNAAFLAMENESIEVLVDRIRHLPIPLAAITLPHKESILPFLDKVDPLAQSIGAVNTVLNKDGQLHGYNTDVLGIERALLDLDLHKKKALIVGAGGAAKAVAHVLHQKGAELFIMNRNQERAEQLATTYGAHVVQSPPAGLELMVNATPEPVTKTAAHFFDLDYHKDPRALRMFVEQGLEQVRLFTGQALESEPFFKLFQE